jgi:hypothetical protein
MMKPVVATPEPPADVTEVMSRSLEDSSMLNSLIPTNASPLILTTSTRNSSPSPAVPMLPTTASPSLVVMANFTVDPEPFVPPAMVLEDGVPLHWAWRVVYIRGGITKSREDCTIAVVSGDLLVATRHQILHDITNYIVTQHQLNLKLRFASS